MTLSEYMKSEGLTAMAFAEMISAPTSTVTRWINGETSPSLDLIIRIDDATEGKVTAEDFVREKRQKKDDAA